MNEFDDDDDDDSGGVSSDLFASYLAFGARALSRRRLLAGAVFLSILSLTIAAATLWPRTYHCESRLMAQTNEVFALRGDANNYPLRGASDIVGRQDNLDAIVKQADLVRAWRDTRPLILRLKDAVMNQIRGPISDKDQESALRFALGNVLTAVSTDTALTFAVDWPDAETSARILEAAQENFLEARHVAEISTLSEYISILEGHATTLRGEVDEMAKEVQNLRESKVAAAEGKAPKTATSGATGMATPTTTVRRVVSRPHNDLDDDELARLKVTLETKQRAIAELEDYRNRRLLDLQSKLVDLQSKYTPAHPAIVDTQQAILAVSQPSPQVVNLHAEMKDLEAQIKSRAEAATAPGTSTTSFGGAEPGVPGTLATAGPLPADIMNLMQENPEQLDPAIAAQLRYAVEKYTTLRSQISSGRIDLDTAQAAFKHRYKIVLAPEAPLKAAKPKVPVIVGVGLVAAIVLSLLAAIAAELRQGRIVERWQVEQIALPVLGELRFPPRSSD